MTNRFKSVYLFFVRSNFLLVGNNGVFYPFANVLGRVDGSFAHLGSALTHAFSEVHGAFADFAMFNVGPGILCTLGHSLSALGIGLLDVFAGGRNLFLALLVLNA